MAETNIIKVGEGRVEEGIVRRRAQVRI